MIPLSSNQGRPIGGGVVQEGQNINQSSMIDGVAEGGHNNSTMIIGSIPDEHGAAEISPERELLVKNESVPVLQKQQL
jgi:hypothetical protein